MKQKFLFVLIGAIALIGLSSCQSVYDVPDVDPDIVIGYRILTTDKISVQIINETGADFVVDSLDKSDYGLLITDMTTSLTPVEIKPGKYLYQVGMSVPIEGASPLESEISIEISGIEYPFEYKGKSYTLKPIQALYIVVGEMKEYKDDGDDDGDDDDGDDGDDDSGDSVEKRYTVEISLVAEDFFTGKDIVLAKKNHCILITDRDHLMN